MYKFVIALAVAMLALAGMTGEAGAKSRYSIQPGDILQIEVLEDKTLNRSALVLPDGTISFPVVGTVRASGRTVDAVRANLTAGLAGNFATTPNVYVSVAQLGERKGPAAPATISIYAMGEVAKPGMFEAEPGTTLLQALASVGGFSKFAAVKRVQLRRADPKTGIEQIYIFNYKGGGIAGSTPLRDGDVIAVPERKLFE